MWLGRGVPGARIGTDDKAGDDHPNPFDLSLPYLMTNRTNACRSPTPKPLYNSTTSRSAPVDASPLSYNGKLASIRLRDWWLWRGPHQRLDIGVCTPGTRNCMLSSVKLLSEVCRRFVTSQCSTFYAKVNIRRLNPILVISTWSESLPLPASYPFMGA